MRDYVAIERLLEIARMALSWEPPGDMRLLIQIGDGDVWAGISRPCGCRYSVRLVVVGTPCREAVHRALDAAALGLAVDSAHGHLAGQAADGGGLLNTERMGRG